MTMYSHLSDAELLCIETAKVDVLTSTDLEIELLKRFGALFDRTAHLDSLAGGHFDISFEQMEILRYIEQEDLDDLDLWERALDVYRALRRADLDDTTDARELVDLLLEHDGVLGLKEKLAHFDELEDIAEVCPPDVLAALTKLPDLITRVKNL